MKKKKPMTQKSPQLEEVMKSIQEKKPEVAKWIKEEQDLLLEWSSAYIYKEMSGKKKKKHLLEKIEEKVDFTEMEEACQTYHKRSGKGSAVTHQVEKLIRMLVVRYLYNQSLRETEEDVNWHIKKKQFVGYRIGEACADHTTLSRFENYVMVNYPRMLFDSVLGQILEAYPSEKKKKQMADTFAILANAALETLIERLRHCGQELTKACKRGMGSQYKELYEKIEKEHLFGEERERAEWKLGNKEKQERLKRTVVALNQLVQAVKGTVQSEEMRQWVERIEKIFKDELRLQYDEDQEVVGMTVRKEKERGTYRTCSGTDPDATIRNHGPEKVDYGFNGSILATNRFIMETQVDTGSRPDEQALPEMLASQLKHHNHAPEKVIYDSAAGKGESLQAVHNATNGKTQLVVKLKQVGCKKGIFTPQHFTLSDDQLSLTCPNGKTTTRKYRSGSGDGHTFRFPAKGCQGCRFRSRCRENDKPNTPRNVFVSRHYSLVERALAYAETDAFKDEMRFRSHVERMIAIFVLFCGGRQAIFRSTPKVDFQVKMQATMFNLKTWCALDDKKKREMSPKLPRRFRAPVPNPDG